VWAGKKEESGLGKGACGGERRGLPRGSVVVHGVNGGVDGSSKCEGQRNAVLGDRCGERLKQ